MNGRALAIEQPEGADDPNHRDDAVDDARQLGQKAMLAQSKSLRLRINEAAIVAICLSVSIEIMSLAS